MAGPINKPHAPTIAKIGVIRNFISFLLDRGILMDFGSRSAPLPADWRPVLIPLGKARIPNSLAATGGYIECLEATTLAEGGHSGDGRVAGR
jgi:hypothetical protein